MSLLDDHELEREEPRKLSGVILAGGDRSHITGFDKSLRPFKGKPLILEQIERMRPICGELIVVTNEPGLYLPIVERSVRVITNPATSSPLLSGLHAALKLAAFPDVWVVAEGMPWISPEAALMMVETKHRLLCDAVVPVVDGYAYPLHGVYDKMAAEAASAVINAGKREIQDMFGLIYWQGIAEKELFERGIDTACLHTIETMDEYERFSGA